MGDISLTVSYLILYDSLLQNATEVSNKMRQFYYKIRRLLQIATAQPLMKWYQLCGCMQQIVLYRLVLKPHRPFNWLTSHNDNHLVTNLLGLKQAKFITIELKKYQIAFSKTTEKASLKYQKLKKTKKRTGKKSYKLKET